MLGIGLVLVVLIAHFLIGSALPWWQRELAALPGCAAAYAGWDYVSKRKWYRLPFLEYALIEIYVTWGMPAVAQEDSLLQFPSEVTTQAVIAPIAICLCLLAAYPLGVRAGSLLRPILNRMGPRRPGQAVGLIFIPWVLLAFIVAAGFEHYLPLAVQYPVSVLGSYYALLAMLALAAERSKSLTTRWMFFGTAILLAFAGLSTGMTENAVRPLLVVGLLILVVFHNLPWKLVAAVVGLIVLLQPAKFVYRSMAWTDDQNGSTQLENAYQRWTYAFQQTWLNEGSTPDGSDAISSRLDELRILETTFAMVPAIIPFDYGSQWKWILLSPVPRVILPEKPNKTIAFNDRFNITFGFQSTVGVRTTTMAFPLVSDGYWNFGWPGIVFVGLLIGFVLGAQTSAIPLDSWFGLSLAIGLIAEMHANGPLIDQIGGLFQMTIGICLSCWIVWLSSSLFLGRIAARRASPRRAATPPPSSAR